MATIDNLDVSIYNLYAVRAKLIEDINFEFHFEDASYIPPQTTLIDLYPKLTELDILLGIAPRGGSWAFFYPPKNISHMRKSPFTPSRIMPSLGEEEDCKKTLENLRNKHCRDGEEEREKEVLLNCIHQVGRLNEWLGFIVGRIGQFLQG